MPPVNHRLMSLFRAKIAIDDIPKKVVASEVEIEPKRFSEMLKAERPMPLDARMKLVKFLGLEDALKSMNAKK